MNFPVGTRLFLLLRDIFADRSSVDHVVNQLQLAMNSPKMRWRFSALE
jgi:hypothetical protein